MKIVGLSSVALLAALHAGGAGGSSDPVFGFWLVESQQSIIEIVPCGERVCGIIVWLKEPLDDDGQPKTDRRNSDDNLRDRPICGMALIGGFRSADPGTWSGGSIYNPNEGQAYSASMKLRDDGTLKLRGYVLLPLFGKSQVWTREAGDRGGC
jgi:uncharacterized protein (DUF2147 family)